MWLLQVFTFSLFTFKCRQLLKRCHSTNGAVWRKKTQPLSASWLFPRQTGDWEPNVLGAGRNYLKRCLIIKSVSLKSLGGTNNSAPFNAGYSKSSNTFLIRHLFNLLHLSVNNGLLLGALAQYPPTLISFRRVCYQTQDNELPQQQGS